MPSFPTSVFAPSAKTTGQTIQASHVDDLQDELVAIEGGYLNGTAPLNSSNSTVANLSVPGGSTLATLNVTGGSTVANLSVTGGSTLANLVVNNLQVNGNSSGIVVANTNILRASVVADLSSTSGQPLTVTYLTHDWALNSSLHSTGSNPSRFVPDSTGFWTLKAQVQFSPAAGGSRQVFIQDSSNASIGRARVYEGSTGTVAADIQLSATKHFDVLGGYLVVITTHDAASTVAIAAVDTWVEFTKLA